MLQGRRIRHAALALILAVSAMALFLHLSYAENSALACPVNPVPSFMDVIIEPPQGEGSMVSVLVYNISEDDYIKNGIQGGLVILVNQSDKTNIQLMYDITNSEGWSQFNYNSETEGCTDYWFIFCPLTDAINSIEARQMCLNGTKLSQDIIQGNMPSANPAPPSQGHGCAAKTTQASCENACSTGNLAPPAQNTQLPPIMLSPVPAQEEGVPLTSAGFFVPSPSGDTSCQSQAWMYTICNPDSPYVHSACTSLNQGQCSIQPGCKWDISDDGNFANDKCTSWDYLCEGCMAAVDNPDYCHLISDPAQCTEQLRPGCYWNTNENNCQVYFGCPGSPDTWLCNGRSCCSNGQCTQFSWSQCPSYAPQLPSRINTVCSNCANLCDYMDCAQLCPWGQSMKGGVLCCLDSEHYCTETRTCSVDNQCCSAGQTRCSDGVCRDSCCGGEDQPCCENDVCTAPLQCNTTAAVKTCYACGAAGQPCCENDQCTVPNTICNAAQSCVACGGEGQPCCASDYCESPLRCDTAAAVKTCYACGEEGQPCCNGLCTVQNTVCNAATQSCVACGGADLPCCDGSICTATGSTCESGICTGCTPPMVRCPDASCNLPSLCCPVGEHICTSTGVCSEGGACCEAGQTHCPDGSCQPSYCAWNSVAGTCEERFPPNAPGYEVPLNADTSRYLPSLNQFYVCNKKPSTYAGLCWPVMLILGLLIGASFLAGRNPFSAFDFSSPRMGRGKAYTMRNQNRSFDITSAVMIGANKALETGSGVITGKAEEGLLTKWVTGGIKGVIGGIAGVSGTKVDTETGQKGKGGELGPASGEANLEGRSKEVNKTPMSTSAAYIGKEAIANASAPDDKVTFSKAGLRDKVNSAFAKVGSLSTIGTPKFFSNGQFLQFSGTPKFREGGELQALFSNKQNPTAGDTMAFFANRVGAQISQFVGRITNAIESMFSGKNVGEVIINFILGLVKLYAIAKELNDIARMYKSIAKGLGVSNMGASESQRGFGFMENFDQGTSGIRIFGRDMTAGEMIRMIDADPTSYAGVLSVLQPTAQLLRDKAEYDARKETGLAVIGKTLKINGKEYTLTSEYLLFDSKNHEINGADKAALLVKHNLAKINEEGKMDYLAKYGDIEDMDGKKDQFKYLVVGANGVARETTLHGYTKAKLKERDAEELRARMTGHMLDVKHGFGYVNSEEFKKANLVHTLTGQEDMKDAKKWLDGLKAYELNGTMPSGLKPEEKKAVAREYDLALKALKEAYRDVPVSESIDSLYSVSSSDIKKMLDTKGMGSLSDMANNTWQLDLYNAHQSSLKRVEFANASLHTLGMGSVGKKEHLDLMYNDNARLLSFNLEKQKDDILADNMTNHHGMVNSLTEMLQAKTSVNEKRLKDNNALIEKNGPNLALESENKLLNTVIGIQNHAPKGSVDALLTANKIYMEYRNTQLTMFNEQSRWLNASWDSGKDLSEVSKNMTKSASGAVKDFNSFVANRERVVDETTAFKKMTDAILMSKGINDSIEKDPTIRNMKFDKETRSDLKLMDKGCDDVINIGAQALGKLGTKDGDSALGAFNSEMSKYGVKYEAVDLHLKRDESDIAFKYLKEAKDLKLDDEMDVSLVKATRLLARSNGTDYAGSQVNMTSFKMNVYEFEKYVNDLKQKKQDGLLKKGTDEYAKALAALEGTAQAEPGSEQPWRINVSTGRLEDLTTKYESGLLSKIEEQESRAYRSSYKGVDAIHTNMLRDWVAQNSVFANYYLGDIYGNLLNEARGGTQSHSSSNLLLTPFASGYEHEDIERIHAPVETDKIDYTPKEEKPLELPKVDMPEIQMPVETLVSTMETRVYIAHLDEQGRQEVKKHAKDIVSHYESEVSGKVGSDEKVVVTVSVPYERANKENKSYNERLEKALVDQAVVEFKAAGIDNVEVRAGENPTLNLTKLADRVDEDNFKKIQSEFKKKGGVLNDDMSPISKELKSSGFDYSQITGAKNAGEMQSALREANTHLGGEPIYVQNTAVSKVLMETDRVTTFAIEKATDSPAEKKGKK